MLDGNEPSNEEIRQHFALLPLGQRMCLTERQMVGVLLDRLASRAPTPAQIEAAAKAIRAYTEGTGFGWLRIYGPDIPKAVADALRAAQEER